MSCVIADCRGEASFVLRAYRSPQCAPGRNIHQLAFNIAFIAMLSHAPCKYCIDMQVGPEPLRINFSRFVARHDASSPDLEVGEAGRGVRDLLRKTLAEVVH